MNQKKYEGMKAKLKYIYAAFGTLLVIALITFFMSDSFSELLENDVELEPNTELTYYLKVTYDGVDRQGVESNDDMMADIHSGSIYVQDKLPEGLIFQGFLPTEDGNIVAIKRGDGTTACSGKVVDDTKESSVTSGTWNAGNTEYTYHGLHYDAASRMVTFEVKNLQAGCELTVGIITKTPSTVDDPSTPEIEVRRDFYNTATAREGTFSKDSNVVHAFMGNGTATLYNVAYEYSGTIPSDAPTLPVTNSYAAGAKVGVEKDAVMEGYTFSGWTCEGVTITNQQFTMPSSNVVCKGSFSNVSKYKVKYQLTGTTPEGYVLPKEKEYYPDTNVSVDTGLQEGETYRGYRFLGWETTDVTVEEEGDFVMPSSDVILTGEFEEITYEVSYQFSTSVLPPNAENYLPDATTYKPGATVTLEDVKTEPTNYSFLGWNKESSFEMPEEDVVIYGEWKRVDGTFAPTITGEVVNDKGYYRPGQTIRFKITVTNTASFPIRDIMIKEELEDAKFVENASYTIESDHIASVATLPAGSSVDFYVDYVVKETDQDKVENVVYLIGALNASNDSFYELEEKEYKVTVSTKVQSQIRICKEVNGTGPVNTFQFFVTGTTNSYETWVTLQKDECKNLYVVPSTYRIREITPQEYSLHSVRGAVSEDNQVFTVAHGTNYEIIYTNQFTKKGFFHSSGRVVNTVSQGEVG